MAELLKLDGVWSGYGEAIVLEDIGLASTRATASRCSGATAWASRRCSPR